MLDQAVAAYGGLTSLRSIKTVSLKAAGDSLHRNQSRRTGMAERTPYNMEPALDLTRNRFSQTAKEKVIR